MKKNIILVLLLLATNVCTAQLQSPVSFTYTAIKISETIYTLHITAVIEDKWHIYSQTTPAGGPVPTKITLSKNPLVVVGDKPKEVGKLEQHFEKLFGVHVKQFSEKVDFVQTVKLKKPVKTNISGTIEFMVCNDEQCLPPTTNKFSISLN